MKKKIIATVVTACTIMSMTACTSTGTGNSVTGNSESQTEVSDLNVSSAEDSSDTTAAGSDETNAGFAYTGTYYGDRCQMILESDGQSKVKIKARWAGSAKEFSEWTMTGDYDKETNMITYTDGVKKEVTYSDETTIDKENTVYSDGTGTLIFSTSGESFTWTDKKENAADGLIFRIYKDETEASGSAPSDGASDENYYTAFSAMSKSGIEENADKIRKLYLAEDWEGMKTMIRYPVMINGASVENEEEYLKVMKGKKISEDSRKAMEEETCKNMFFNGQGLCLGSGQVWLLDPSYMTENTPEIKIKTIQGIG